MGEPGNAEGERRKWMIVGGLALAFITVLWVQLSPAPEDAPATQLAERPRKPKAAVGAASAVGAWPRFELAEVLKTNPFAPLPRPEPPRKTAEENADAEPLAEAARSAATMSAMQTKRVRAIFMTDRGPAAMLGTTIVHEGDVFDGVRVVAIRADGIVVEPAESAPK